MKLLAVVLIVVAILLVARWVRRREPGPLAVGEVAPDFVMNGPTGEPVRLYDLLARNNVVLYFYLQDYTPG